MVHNELRAARAGDERAFARLVEPFRRELRAHCYRMSGSIHDADDLLQESLLRAWRGLSTFEERSGVRTWLYKVTTHVCIDVLRQRAARSLPNELGPAAGTAEPLGPPRLDPVWVEPCPESFYAEAAPSPEARYGARESVALAFLVALQLLTPRQRAVLILRDVVGATAAECADLLEATVPAVNAALKRARETLESRSASWREPSAVDDEQTRGLLARYLEAWEQADVAKLVALLHEDATLSMPPIPQWLQGARIIGPSIDAMVFARQGAGAIKMVEIRANGAPAFAAYFRDGPSGSFQASGIHVLGIRDGRIESITAFLDASLFDPFALPRDPDRRGAP